MFVIYLLSLLLNFWMINCNDSCDCQMMEELRDVLQREIFERKLETTRLMKTVRRVESSQRSASSTHGASDFTDRLDMIEARMADIGRQLDGLTYDIPEDSKMILNKAFAELKTETKSKIAQCRSEVKSSRDEFMQRLNSVTAQTGLAVQQIAHKWRGAMLTANMTECFSGQAIDYEGTRSTTVSGFECQRWDQQTPHEHKYKDEMFADCSKCRAKNYCRDPGKDGYLWCYTTDPDKRWEGCGIPWCQEPERHNHTHDCFIIPAEDKASGKSDEEICRSYVNRVEVLPEVRDTYPGCKNCESCCQMKGCHTGCPHCYSGTWYRTLSGRLCQRWDVQKPHKHEMTKPELFPENATVTAAENYCRDPTESGDGCYYVRLKCLSSSFLWCYTMDPNLRWEKCDIPEC